MSEGRAVTRHQPLGVRTLSAAPVHSPVLPMVSVPACPCFRGTGLSQGMEMSYRCMRAHTPVHTVTHTQFHAHTQSSSQAMAAEVQPVVSVEHLGFQVVAWGWCQQQMGQWRDQGVCHLPLSLLLHQPNKDQRAGRFSGDKEGGVLGWTLPLQVPKNPGKNQVRNP